MTTIAIAKQYKVPARDAIELALEADGYTNAAQASHTIFEALAAWSPRAVNALGWLLVAGHTDTAIFEAGTMTHGLGAETDSSIAQPEAYLLNTQVRHAAERIVAIALQVYRGE
jgi:hypothetical protein